MKRAVLPETRVVAAPGGGSARISLTASWEEPSSAGSLSAKFGEGDPASDARTKGVPRTIASSAADPSLVAGQLGAAAGPSTVTVTASVMSRG